MFRTVSVRQASRYSASSAKPEILFQRPNLCLTFRDRAIERFPFAGQPSKALFGGIDGLADGCLSIQNGELTASVLQNADVMSEEGVRLLMEMINGNIDHDEYIVDGVLITADNVEEMIDMHRANGIIK